VGADFEYDLESQRLAQRSSEMQATAREVMPPQGYLGGRIAKIVVF
jgi:hypothetical protein